MQRVSIYDMLAGRTINTVGRMFDVFIMGPPGQGLECSGFSIQKRHPGTSAIEGDGQVFYDSSKIIDPDFGSRGFQDRLKHRRDMGIHVFNRLFRFLGHRR